VRDRCYHFGMFVGSKTHRSEAARRNYYLRHPERAPRLVFTRPGWNAIFDASEIKSLKTFR
jgi:hypothetical protein